MSDRVIVFSWGRSDTCPGVRVSANAQRQTCRAPGVAPGPEAGLLATNPPCCPRAGRAHGAGGARGRARVEALRWIYSLSHAAAGRCCAAPRTALPPPPGRRWRVPCASCWWRRRRSSRSSWRRCSGARASALPPWRARLLRAPRGGAPRGGAPHATPAAWGQMQMTEVARGVAGGEGAPRRVARDAPPKILQHQKKRRAPPRGPRRRARAGADHGLCVVRSRTRECAAGRLRALPREEAVSQSFAWL